MQLNWFLFDQRRGRCDTEVDAIYSNCVNIEKSLL